MPTDIRVTEHDAELMLRAATRGETVEPTTPAAERLWVAIKREVAEIKARGLIVDIPADIP